MTPPGFHLCRSEPFPHGRGFFITVTLQALSAMDKGEYMDKEKKEAIQVTKEIVVKFIETGRVSPSNISEVFPAVFEVVSSTVCDDEKETEE